jgi:hypothetical protein
MNKSLEERVRRLEAHRIVSDGYINALQATLIAFMTQFLIHSKDKKRMLAEYKAFLLSEADRANSPGYDIAVAALTKRLGELIELNERRKN